jgi:hypothetical protein
MLSIIPLNSTNDIEAECFIFQRANPTKSGSTYYGVHAPNMGYTLAFILLQNALLYHSLGIYREMNGT